MWCSQRPCPHTRSTVRFFDILKGAREGPATYRLLRRLLGAAGTGRSGGSAAGCMGSRESCRCGLKPRSRVRSLRMELHLVALNPVHRDPQRVCSSSEIIRQVQGHYVHTGFGQIQLAGLTSTSRPSTLAVVAPTTRCGGSEWPGMPVRPGGLTAPRPVANTCKAPPAVSDSPLAGAALSPLAGGPPTRPGKMPGRTALDGIVTGSLRRWAAVTATRAASPVISKGSWNVIRSGATRTSGTATPETWT